MCLLKFLSLLKERLVNKESALRELKGGQINITTVRSPIKQLWAQLFRIIYYHIKPKGSLSIPLPKRLPLKQQEASRLCSTATFHFPYTAPYLAPHKWKYCWPRAAHILQLPTNLLGQNPYSSFSTCFSGPPHEPDLLWALLYTWCILSFNQLKVGSPYWNKCMWNSMLSGICFRIIQDGGGGLILGDTRLPLKLTVTVGGWVPVGSSYCFLYFCLSLKASTVKSQNI